MLLLAVAFLSGCGSPGAIRHSTPVERAAITHEIRVKVPTSAGDHLVVVAIAILRADPHFATAEIELLDRRGHLVTDRAIVQLIEIDGQWQVIDYGTGFSCGKDSSTAKPFVALMCPDPYAKLGMH